MTCLNCDHMCFGECRHDAEQKALAELASADELTAARQLVAEADAKMNTGSRT
jgi:hypothetical protein